jgi:2-oxoacid:acceptor oxidoreductase delta subunit (pyruvate/2-ketoisovalerate family)
MPKPPYVEPVISVSRASTSQNRTGSWKYIRPLYRDAVAPCNQACPAGVDVEGYMNLLREGRVDDAIELLLRENPMPAITGRVCHHPCETGCNRRDLDEAVSVHAVERALGDHSLRHPHPPPPPVLHPERVGVVGGGPAGLACAYHLARLGYSVTIYDEAAEAGGLLRQGIPSYRLPRQILDRQIDRITSMGVDIRTGIQLSGDAARAELEGYDAVFYATGAHRGKPMGVEGEDGPGILAGLEFLKEVNRGARPEIGQRVAVIGGGNTAMDCARTALRLGSEPVVVYRRTRDEMPAIAQEIDEAMGEGIEFVFLAAPAGFDWSEDGRLVGMRVTRMELGEPDASGRRRPVPMDDGGYTIPVDTVLTAIGEDTTLDVLPGSLTTQWGAVSVNDFGATGADVDGGSGRGAEHGAGKVAADGTGKGSGAPIFAGGDLAGVERTVADALGSGKRAAMGIDQHFRGAREGEDGGSALDALRWGKGQVSMSRWRDDDPVRRTNPTNDVVDVAALQLAHFPAVPRNLDRWREGWIDFGEVNLGIDLEEAVAEARRCFNCAVCNDCELCLILCPDVAITRREGGGFEIDLDHCKGCGVCAEECPRGAIVMTREGL